MQKLTKTNQSVEKTLQIIETMAAAREPLRLADIALKVQMPASTTLRMVNTLVQQGYAYQEANSLRYGLTLRFTQIGSQVNAQLSIRDIAHPILVRLTQDYNESACLAIEEEMEVIYIDVVDGPDGLLKITQRIGKRAPMHSTGVGKLMLTQYTPAMLALLIEKRGLLRLTPNTVTSMEDLNKEMELIRQRGYALDDEECELGARCLAAPVRNFEGKIVAAISLSGPISRMNLKRISEVAPSLITAADEIARLLAYQKR
jgi:DNA-binding IclR family transcriptional regulator